MRRILIFLCLVASVISDTHKMMVNYGFVVDYKIHKGLPVSINREELVISWSECLDYCLEDMSCVVVQDAVNYCQMYRLPSLKEVIKVDAVNGSRVGIKRIMNYCPLPEDGPPLFGKAIVQEKYQSDNVIYSYTISETTGTDVRWIFDSEYYFECPTDSFISIRGINRVCISFRNFSSFDYYCQQRTAALTLCQKNGATGLTGPFSKEEGEMLTKYGLQHIEIGAFFDYVWFWIDGERISGTTTVTDDTLNQTNGYNWNTAIPPEFLEREGPIHFFLTQDKYKNNSIYVNVIIGETDNHAGMGICFAGVFCRSKPIKDF